MRVRVTFRYNQETGEVEEFRIDHVGTTLRAADHDARHERVARDVARVVEANALIQEVAYEEVVLSTTTQPLTTEEPQAETQPQPRERRADG